MAAERERRANAGHKMSSLLESMENDEFYESTYGGFDEEADDIDYKSDQSDSEDIDYSDIDIDENEDAAAAAADDSEDDKPKRKPRGGVYTKAYKEPVRVKKKVGDSGGAVAVQSVVAASGCEPGLPSPGAEAQPAAVAVGGQRAAARRGRPSNRVAPAPASLQKPLTKHHMLIGAVQSRRKSTQAKTRETEKRVKERARQEAATRQRRAQQEPRALIRQLTQREMLEEAKITEKMNLRALENYKRLEESKKKVKTVKTRSNVAMIRFVSTSFPDLDDSEEEGQENGIVPLQTSLRDGSGATGAGEKRYMRNFVTFEDEQAFSTCFPKKKYKPPAPKKCPITGMKAKYFDPITQSRYANKHAFTALRDAYFEHMLTRSKPRCTRQTVEWMRYWDQHRNNRRLREQQLQQQHMLNKQRQQHDTMLQQQEQLQRLKLQQKQQQPRKTQQYFTKQGLQIHQQQQLQQQQQRLVQQQQHSLLQQQQHQKQQQIFLQQQVHLKHQQQQHQRVQVYYHPPQQQQQQQSYLQQQARLQHQQQESHLQQQHQMYSDHQQQFIQQVQQRENIFHVLQKKFGT